MISAFGVDHGDFSKAEHPLGFVDKPRVKQPWAESDAPAETAHNPKHRGGRGKLSVGKWALVGGGSFAAGQGLRRKQEKKRHG